MLKRTLITITMAVFALLAFAQTAADLFFSEYVEGSSNNKALEIFNGTGAEVDLSGYTIKLGSNGGAWSTTNILTPAAGTMLANNHVFVIANAGANTTIQAVADVQSTVTYYNGDDCVALFHGDTMIDAIGVYQVDPGTAWDVAGVTGATLNHTLVRKENVVQGNVNWTASAGTSADNSEWEVYDIDYITNLGQHTFNPGGGQQAATPTFNPPAGVYTQAISVTLASTTADASIFYTLDGSAPSNSSTPYSMPIPLNSDTTVKAIAYATGFDPSYVATAAYYFPLVVSNLSQLREQTPGDGTVYMVSNQVILTFQQDFRHQKYVQDNGAGIMIDDTAGIISGTYNLMDGITGLTGTILDYNGMLEFIPVMNPGAASSTNNTVGIPTVTTADIAANYQTYQARLVRIANCHFAETGNFASGANYTLTDASGTVVFRTGFYSVDYIGEAIPTGNININVLVNQYNATTQVAARMLADWAPVANDDPIIVPVTTQLIGNNPNPFNPETTISFYTAKAEPVQIYIYNQKGQMIRSWDLGTKAEGSHTISWNGRDNNGNAVSSGIYFYKMQAGKYSSTRKMVMMK
jgi:hypothetical protein